MLALSVAALKDALAANQPAQKPASLKTRVEVEQDFQRRGASIRAWAIAQGVDPVIASHVVSGRLKGLRGESHNIAVLLGLKAGVVNGNGART
jgi:gp16 family phage-associated protein